MQTERKQTKAGWGTKADAAVLASRFDVSAEARTDVAEAYEATLKKLEKKKS